MMRMAQTMAIAAAVPIAGMMGKGVGVLGRRGEERIIDNLFMRAAE
jgi:hypothetical protein